MSNSFPRTLLGDLRCAYCGSGFETALELAASSQGIGDGILRCDCYEYPVVQGIPVLRQISPVSSAQNGAVEFLRQGNSEGALRWLLDSASAPGVSALTKSPTKTAGGSSLFRRLRNLWEENAALPGDLNFLQIDEFEEALRASRPRGYADYLYHRFANPSFLGAIPPLVMIGDVCRQSSGKRLLELMCGTGHSSAIVSTLCSGVNVVMADVDFVNLFIARRYVAPEAAAVCIDAEVPLPFADMAFDCVYCLDGLHYARSKVALLREVDRIISTEGAWLFAHMHNANGNNVNPGVPLTARGYAMRFTFGQQRLVAEREVLRQFQADGSLDLTEQASIEALDSSNAITLMGARNASMWRRHEFLDDALCRRPDLLSFNPLYRVERVADGLMARATWPSESLRIECAGTALNCVPETIHLPYRIVEEIAAARVEGTLSNEVRKLLRSFVLVCLPECYPRSGRMDNFLQPR